MPDLNDPDADYQSDWHQQLIMLVSETEQGEGLERPFPDGGSSGLTLGLLSGAAFTLALLVALLAAAIAPG